MKRSVLCMILLCCMALSTHAIGLQHGLFRSQSTQGEPWQGTATIVDESYNITVHPDYLDVELEWVIEAGGVAPDSFANALEIVGNINLVDKSVVVGMITWYEGMVLQGKLKTNEVAREQYEDVVDRSSDAPPPPRDPVLLEWVRDDNYDISIFPVVFGGTRRVRIHYLIPAFTVEGVNRIDYPYAFSENASVSIRKGPGVQSYRIETSLDQPVILENSQFVDLSPAEFDFQAYGGFSGMQIKTIVPVLKAEPDGSRFYAGAFATPGFEGHMYHVATMSGEQVLKRASLNEDFVILWRWNHPQVLARYARQIVAQSKLLKEFLSGLDAARKRAALIIDRQGGERVTFSLSGPDDSEYARMLAYLDSLSALPVVDPPQRKTPRTEDIPFEIEQAKAEFRQALQAAAALFDDSSAALRHLLLITAGPRLVNSYVADQSVTWDSTINVSLLSSYFHTPNAAADLGSTDYWPGVRLSDFAAGYRGGLDVYATITNGVAGDTLHVLDAAREQSYYCTPQGESQRHLYSPTPLQERIVWRISLNGEDLARFEETPTVVTLENGRQYARVIGGSPHLTPLAPTMPSSLAATLGFIDETYSLVALEEDALPPEQARLYENRGMPVLDESAIFAADDERLDMPIADWLSAHPPEPMTQSACGWFGDDMRLWEVDDMVSTGGPPIVANDAFGRVAMPMTEPLAAYDSDAYLDYESALATAPTSESAAPPTAYSCLVRNGAVHIDLSGMSAAHRRGLTLTVSDLSGRVLRQWRADRLTTGSQLVVPLAAHGFSPGVYVVRLTAPGMQVVRQIVLK